MTGAAFGIHHAEYPFERRFLQNKSSEETPNHC